jgi:FAD/FMN-containing dehydrogenase
MDMSPTVGQSLSEAIQPWIQAGCAIPLDESYCLTPRTAEEAAQVLAWAQNVNIPVAFSAQAANLLPQPLWLSTERLQAIQTNQANDFIVKVQTGVTFSELTKELAKTNQSFPLHYSSDMTIGEILATDRPALETGARGFLSCSYPRDFILKTQIATPDGLITTSGADVVKNVTGYDLHKFYVGSRNVFGILTQVTLKLLARPTSQHYWLSSPLDFEAVDNWIQAIQTQPIPLAICEVFQPLDQKSKDQWHIFIEVAGEEEKSPTIQLLETTFNPAWHTLDDDAAFANLQSLRTWPKTAGVLEIVAPLSQWAHFIQNFRALCQHQPLWANWSIQARPFAGIIYLIQTEWLFPENEQGLELLEQLRTCVQACDGFFQWAQWPAAAYQKPSHFWSQAAHYNLPDDPIQRCLLQSIKHSYDPNGILFTPELPLNPLLQDGRMMTS